MRLIVEVNNLTLQFSLCKHKDRVDRSECHSQPRVCCHPPPYSTSWYSAGPSEEPTHFHRIHASRPATSHVQPNRNKSSRLGSLRKSFRKLVCFPRAKADYDSDSVYGLDCTMNHQGLDSSTYTWMGATELDGQSFYELPSTFPELAAAPVPPAAPAAPYEEVVQNQGDFYPVQQRDEPKSHLGDTALWHPQHVQPSTQGPIHVTVPQRKATTSELTTPDMSPVGGYPHCLINETPISNSATTSNTVSPITPTYHAGLWYQNDMPQKMVIYSPHGRGYHSLSISPLEHHPDRSFDYLGSPSSISHNLAQGYQQAHTSRRTTWMTAPYNERNPNLSTNQHPTTQYSREAGFPYFSPTGEYNNSNSGMRSHHAAYIHQDLQKLENNINYPPHYETALATHNITPTLEGPFPSSDGSSNTLCHKCGRVFAGKYQKGNYNRHRKETCSALEKKVSWKCRECLREYKRKDARRKHEWKKHQLGGKPEKRHQKK